MFASRRLSSLKIFDFSPSVAVIRYGVIFLLSLINGHIRIGKLPMQHGYSFPTPLFINGLLFGLVICTTSWVVTNIFRDWIFKDMKIDWKSTSLFLSVNVAAGIFVYWLLYTARFGPPQNIGNFSVYLFVTLSVLIIENLIFLFYCTLDINQHLATHLETRPPQQMLLPTSKGSAQISVGQIAIACLRNGLVHVELLDGRKISTHLQSLNELEEKLPANLFYRVNRQFIVHRRSIGEIQKESNRKLKLLLNTNQPLEIPVSRYRRRSLLEWLNA